MDSKKILVVDDNPDAISIMSSILNIAGYSVISAGDGLEAMERIKLENPSLILLDVMMPKMDGFEVCQAVKNDPALKHIPIVMVSAKTDSESKRKGLQLGAHDFLTKPIHPAEALRKIQNIACLNEGSAS